MNSEKYYLVTRSLSGVKKVREFQTYSDAFQSIVSDSDMHSWDASWIIFHNDKAINLDLGLKGSYEELENVFNEYLVKKKLENALDRIREGKEELIEMSIEELIDL